jgi:predicted aspartyl protease
MHASLLLLVAATAAVFALPATAAGPEITAEFTRTSLVLVPVRVNGTGPYHFVVDTGATTTTLDDRVATELGLRDTGDIEIVTSAGMFRTPSGAVDELAIGTTRISRLAVSWMRHDELKRDDRRISGVLGQDVLRRRTLTIDYSRRHITLTTDPCADGDVGIDLAWSESRPMVSAAVQGRGLPGAARLVLDSAANALVLFTAPRSGARRASLSTHQASVSTEFLPRVPVVLGGVRREGPAVLIAPAAPRAETGLLPTVWFDRICIDGPRSRATLSATTTRLTP